MGKNFKNYEDSLRVIKRLVVMEMLMSVWNYSFKKCNEVARVDKNITLITFHYI